MLNRLVPGAGSGGRNRPDLCARPGYSHHMGSPSEAETRNRLDFCIPCNPYFPTPEMFSRMRASLETILKYYGISIAGIPFLQKPFTRDTLGRKVREVLDAPSAAKAG